MTTVPSENSLENSVQKSLPKCGTDGEKRRRYLICNPLDTSQLWKGQLAISKAHNIEQLISEDDEEPIRTFDIVIGEELHCRTCNVAFNTLDEYRLHYRDDWHRFNIKAKLRGRAAIGQEEFFDIEDGISSISGSESEGETTLTTKTQVGNPKIVFENSEGQQMAIYRCFLHQKKKPFSNDAELLQSIHSLPLQNQWAVIMLGGGHFAAAIFKGPDLLCHKTFHSYTVRAKQGGGQSSRDNKSGGSHPKSAGAALRRYNEAAFAEHVQSTLGSWTSELDQCNLVFYRAASSNQTILFGEKSTVFKKSDPRLRSVPFPTRRATLKEVKRVWLTLAHIDIIESCEDVENAEQEEIVDGSRERSDGDSDEEMPLNIRLPARYRRKNQESSKADVKVDTELDLFPGEKEIMEKMMEAVSRGNVKNFEKELEKLKEILNVYHEEFHLELTDVLNQRIGQECRTLLHVAAISKRAAIVWKLLEMGCDPTLSDVLGRVAYVLAGDKETRLTFRRFMGANPDSFDYVKAQIPSPLTDEIEKQKLEKAAEKRKQQRQAKKERQVLEKARIEEEQVLERARIEQERIRTEQQREIEQQQRKVEEEKKRFLQLSDREKRALAAERRLLSSLSTSGAATPVLVRCFLCGSDMSGKVPFEYNSSKFCSPPCLQKHRKFNTKA